MEDPPPGPGLLDLPPGLLPLIMQRLPIPDIATAAATCRGLLAGGAPPLPPLFPRCLHSLPVWRLRAQARHLCAPCMPAPGASLFNARKHAICLHYACACSPGRRGVAGQGGGALPGCYAAPPAAVRQLAGPGAGRQLRARSAAAEVRGPGLAVQVCSVRAASAARAGRRVVLAALSRDAAAKPSQLPPSLDLLLPFLSASCCGPGSGPTISLSAWCWRWSGTARRTRFGES